MERCAMGWLQGQEVGFEMWLGYRIVFSSKILNSPSTSVPAQKF